jgi:hypothetical protein
MNTHTRPLEKLLTTHFGKDFKKKFTISSLFGTSIFAEMNYGGCSYHLHIDKNVIVDISIHSSVSRPASTIIHNYSAHPLELAYLLDMDVTEYLINGIVFIKNDNNAFILTEIGWIRA